MAMFKRHLKIEHIGTTQESLMHKMAEDPDNPMVWYRFDLFYGPAIIKWCQTLGIRTEDALDIRQMVLMQLWKSAGEFKYDNRKSFRSYLAKLVLWTSSRYVFKLLDKELNVDKAAEHPWIKNSDTLILENEIDQRYDLELLEMASRLARKQVDPKHWEAFVLQAVEGISPRKTAELLKIKPSMAIWSRWYVQKRIKKIVDSISQSRDFNDDKTN